MVPNGIAKQIYHRDDMSTLSDLIGVKKCNALIVSIQNDLFNSGRAFNGNSLNAEIVLGTYMNLRLIIVEHLSSLNIRMTFLKPKVVSCTYYVVQNGKY